MHAKALFYTDFRGSVENHPLYEYLQTVQGMFFNGFEFQCSAQTSFEQEHDDREGEYAIIFVPGPTRLTTEKIKDITKSLMEKGILVIGDKGDVSQKKFRSTQMLTGDEEVPKCIILPKNAFDISAQNEDKCLVTGRPSRFTDFFQLPLKGGLKGLAALEKGEQNDEWDVTYHGKVRPRLTEDKQKIVEKEIYRYLTKKQCVSQKIKWGTFKIGIAYGKDINAFKSNYKKQGPTPTHQQPIQQNVDDDIYEHAKKCGELLNKTHVKFLKTDSQSQTLAWQLKGDNKSYFAKVFGMGNTRLLDEVRVYQSIKKNILDKGGINFIRFHSFCGLDKDNLLKYITKKYRVERRSFDKAMKYLSMCSNDKSLRDIEHKEIRSEQNSHEGIEGEVKILQSNSVPNLQDDLVMDDRKTVESYGILVTDFCSGITLEEKLTRLWHQRNQDGVSTPTRDMKQQHVLLVKKLFLQVFIALFQMHDYGIMHGDLHLKNVLLLPDRTKNIMYKCIHKSPNGTEETILATIQQTEVCKILDYDRSIRDTSKEKIYDPGQDILRLLHEFLNHAIANISGSVSTKKKQQLLDMLTEKEDRGYLKTFLEKKRSTLNQDEKKDSVEIQEIKVKHRSLGRRFAEMDRLKLLKFIASDVKWDNTTQSNNNGIPLPSFRRRILCKENKNKSLLLSSFLTLSGNKYDKEERKNNFFNCVTPQGLQMFNDRKPYHMFKKLPKVAEDLRYYTDFDKQECEQIADCIRIAATHLNPVIQYKDEQPRPGLYKKELTPEEENIIENIKNIDTRSSYEPVIYGGSKLRLQDIKRLLPRGELNNEVIDFMMEMYNVRSKRNGRNHHFFDTAFYNTNIRQEKPTNKVTLSGTMLDMQKIFIPIHSKCRHHWTMAVIDVENKQFQYYDSMYDEDKKDTYSKILDRLQSFLTIDHEQYLGDKEKPDFKSWAKKPVPGLPRQENDHDCGVFALKFAEYISGEMDPANVDKTLVSYYRHRMILQILNRSLD